ncbi:MAG: hypothetical protein WCO84_07030 [bacterium]
MGKPITSERELDNALRGMPTPKSFEVHYKNRNQPVTFADQYMIEFENVRRIVVRFPEIVHGGIVDDDDGMAERNRRRARGSR